MHGITDEQWRLMTPEQQKAETERRRRLNEAADTTRQQRAPTSGDITGADFALGLATGVPMPSVGGILGASLHNASHSADYSSPSHHSSSSHDSGSSSSSDSGSSSSSSDSGGGSSGGASE